MLIALKGVGLCSIRTAQDLYLRTMILDAFRYKAILESSEDKLRRYVLGIHVHCFTTILLQVFTTRSAGTKRQETAEEGELVKHAAAPDPL